MHSGYVTTAVPSLFLLFSVYVSAMLQLKIKPVLVFRFKFLRRLWTIVEKYVLSTADSFYNADQRIRGILVLRNFSWEIPSLSLLSHEKSFSLSRSHLKTWDKDILVLISKNNIERNSHWKLLLVSLWLILLLSFLPSKLLKPSALLVCTLLNCLASLCLTFKLQTFTVAKNN